MDFSQIAPKMAKRKMRIDVMAMKFNWFKLWDEFVKDAKYIILPDEDRKQQLPVRTVAIDFAQFVVQKIKEKNAAVATKDCAEPVCIACKRTKKEHIDPKYCAVFESDEPVSSDSEADKED